MELLPGKKFRKYEIVKRLAVGGMAEVYLARTLGYADFSRPIVLKRILPHLAHEHGLREMFLREASVAVRLNHPHIVHVLDFMEEDGELILAMEYVDGASLKGLHDASLSRAAINNSPCISPMLAANICRSVAQALNHAWNVPNEQGQPSHIVHRDVSPQNILLSHEGEVKLADFGIAKPANLNTSRGVIKGKLHYLSPEQGKAEELDDRSDVFALGIVLYETALNLKAPLFSAMDQVGVLCAIINRAIIPPISIKPDFPPLLSSIIMKALQRERENRFQSAKEFASALSQSIHSETSSPEECDLAAYMRLIYGESKERELAHFSYKPKVNTPKKEAINQLLLENVKTPVQNNAECMLNDFHAAPLIPKIEQTDTTASNLPNTLGTVSPVDVSVEITASKNIGKRKLRIGIIAGLFAAALCAFIGIKITRKSQINLYSSVEPLVSQDTSQNKVALSPNQTSIVSTTDSGITTDREIDAGIGGLSSIKKTEDASSDQIEKSKPNISPELFKKRPRTIEKSGAGTLVINLRPYGWAIIGVDNETPELVDTPVITRKLSSGIHFIRNVLQDGKIITSKVDIKSGKNITVNIGNILKEERH